MAAAAGMKLGANAGTSLKQQFSALDANGDGRISRQEASANPQMNSLYDSLDTNSTMRKKSDQAASGISFDQYEAGMQAASHGGVVGPAVSGGETYTLMKDGSRSMQNSANSAMSGMQNKADQSMSNMQGQGQSMQNGMSSQGQRMQNGMNNMQSQGQNVENGMRSRGQSMQNGMQSQGQSMQNGMQSQGQGMQNGMRSQGQSMHDGMNSGMNSSGQMMPKSGNTDNDKSY